MAGEHLFLSKGAKATSPKATAPIGKTLLPIHMLLRLPQCSVPGHSPMLQEARTWERATLRHHAQRAQTADAPPKQLGPDLLSLSAAAHQQ